RHRLRHRRLRLREAPGQPQGADLLDRRALLPRRLPGRGHDQERHHPHLRRERHIHKRDTRRPPGPLPIPTVTIFMEGFRQGVEKYNEDNGTDVKLLGWDGKDGSFTEDFEDKNKDQSVCEQLIGQGADILFPVAGPAGLGGLQAAKDAGAKGIWPDTDGYESTEYGDILLTSVAKGMDVSVTEAIKESIEGTFSNELYTGTLENGGVGLAPYHDFDSQIPQELKDKIDELKQGIIDGSITITPAG